MGTYKEDKELKNIVDSAPGEEISTGVLDNDNQELKHSGTSGTSTIVTSAAILIKMLNYDLSGNEIKNIFEKTSKNKKYDVIINIMVGVF